MKKLDEIYEKAMKLSPDDRVILARHILEAIPNDYASSEIEQAWVEEIKRRIEALDKGEMKTYPAEEVFAEAESRIPHSNHV